MFSSELTRDGKVIPTNGFIKAPAASEAIAFAWEHCRAKDPNQLAWGETGPLLMAQAIREFSLERFLQDHRTFTPIAHFEWERVLEPGWDGVFHASTRAVHFWNEKWRRAGQDKDAHYAPDCIYERLKALYL